MDEPEISLHEVELEAAFDLLALAFKDLAEALGHGVGSEAALVVMRDLDAKTADYLRRLSDGALPASLSRPVSVRWLKVAKEAKDRIRKRPHRG